MYKAQLKDKIVHNLQSVSAWFVREGGGSDYDSQDELQTLVSGGRGGGGEGGGKISETSASGLSWSVEVLLRVTNVKKGPLLLPFS